MLRTLALGHGNMSIVVLLNDRQDYRVSLANDGRSSPALFHGVVVSPYTQLRVTLLVTCLASLSISVLSFRVSRT